MNGLWGDRELGSKEHIKKDEKYAKASLEGRQHGYSLRTVKELCWLVLGIIPSHFLRLDVSVAYISKTGENDIYKRRTDEWIMNRNRLGVPFCNALFIYQRQVCVDRTYLGLSCNSSSILG